MTETAAAPGKPKADPLMLPLLVPITGHSVIREVRLRRPNAHQILANGFPYQIRTTADGEPIFIENDEAIAAYCDACIADGQDKLAIMTGLSMEDTLELRERVIGFFVAAEMKRRTPAAPSTSSSSASSGAPTT